MTYAGIPDQYAQLNTAKVVLIPVPYDGTSTWGKGADKGPEAFLEASENMELYDIETDSEPYKNGIYLADAVTENGSPEQMVEAVYKATTHYLEQGKMVTLFGGEHSISIGGIRAFKDFFGPISVLHFDAHTDLRPSYEGSTANHACALFEAQQTTNLVQIGIRSMDSSEKMHLKPENCFFAHDIHDNQKWQDLALNRLTQKVFITIDLDVFDGGVMPNTGTPEPGGMQWYEVTSFLKKVIQNRNVIGFDIVELLPRANNPAPNFLAAKLYYKILSYIFANN